jgi:4-hydroxy-tetrahydrodipicolinate synthase
MSRQIEMGDCANVLVVAITPRGPDRKVDLDGIRGNVKFLVDHGIQFVMPECGTGQAYDADLAEYESVVGTFLEAAGEDAFVVPGIGPGFGRSLEMGYIAHSLGAAGVMIMPVVGPASAKGVRVGLSEIAEKVKLPTILYQRRLDIMPVKDTIELCRQDSIVGLKYSVDDLGVFRKVNAGAGDHAAMVCGMAEEPSIDYLEEGAVGFSSGMANFVPSLSLKILSSYRNGDVGEARRVRDLMVPFEDFRGERQARYSTSALHAGMNQAGLAGGPVIPFSEDVDEKDLPRVATMLDTLLSEVERSAR